MPIQILKKQNGVERKISDSYAVLNLLTAEQSEKMSVSVSTAKNHVETTKTTSDRAYYILEGKIIINGNLIGNEGDVVFIPANTEYDFKGSFKAVLINSPPFKKENESIKKL